ncbi:MAG: amidohydrolase family protein [Bacillota bacterium]
MIIDAGVYMGPSLFDSGLSCEEIVRNLDRLKIDRAVLIPARPPEYSLEIANRRVSEAVKSHPDRLAGLCRIDPWQGASAVAETFRCLDEYAVGVYLDPREENFQINSESVSPIVMAAAQQDAPVVVNAGYPLVSHPTQVRDLARRFPEVQFVATNGGQINISGMLLSEARRMLEACPNIVIATSGTYREDFLEEVMTEVGEDRVLFASRSPVYDQEFELARVRLAHLEDRQKARMYGETAASVFGLEAG